MKANTNGDMYVNPMLPGEKEYGGAEKICATLVAINTSQVIATPYSKPAQRQTGVKQATNGRINSVNTDAFVSRMPV